jgi:hypothetical protein
MPEAHLHGLHGLAVTDEERRIEMAELVESRAVREPSPRDGWPPRLAEAIASPRRTGTVREDKPVSGEARQVLGDSVDD